MSGRRHPTIDPVAVIVVLAAIPAILLWSLWNWAGDKSEAADAPPPTSTTIVPPPAPLPALNTRFHRLLVESADNELLADMLDDLTHVIEWMYTRRVRERGLWSWEEHTAIAARIAERDLDGAKALACEHIRNARDAYFAAPAH